MPTSRSTSDSAARRIVPIAAAQGHTDCSAAEPFALQVLGDEMLPEFDHGDIIVVEPEGLADDGAYVIAQWQGEWLFRQLRRGESGWSLAALDPAIPVLPIPDLAPVRGVVIQKSKPGRRRSVKRYLD